MYIVMFIALVLVTVTLAVIAANFDGRYLNTCVYDVVRESFSADLIRALLAYTVVYKDWDGRFSRKNREWAHTVPVPDCFDSCMVVETHPAVLDGFINFVRTAE